MINLKEIYSNQALKKIDGVKFDVFLKTKRTVQDLVNLEAVRQEFDGKPLYQIAIIAANLFNSDGSQFCELTENELKELGAIEVDEWLTIVNAVTETLNSESDKKKADTV